MKETKVRVFSGRPTTVFQESINGEIRTMEKMGWSVTGHMQSSLVPDASRIGCPDSRVCITIILQK